MYERESFPWIVRARSILWPLVPGRCFWKESLQSEGTTPATDDHLLELESILTALSHLAPREETDVAKVRERQREKEVIKRRLPRCSKAVKSPVPL